MTDILRVVCHEEGLQKHRLDLLDLPRVCDLGLGQLSLGTQRRISIIRGILTKPGLLLLDEPSASLDPENIERLITYIQV
ncbi:MAG: ATP-binding cassette domain-containing protein, partial [Pseudomonadota bacterium]|nr:ATP-binding cassette domain-containing protein [Pseudomonadota bacterium]